MLIMKMIVMEKKYYRVTVKNIGEKTHGVKDVIYVFAKETNGKLIELLTGAKVYLHDSNYFSIRKFVEQEASLLGIEKLEISKKQLEFVLKTLDSSLKNNYIRDILYVRGETLKETKDMYKMLIDAENRFKEEFGVKNSK